MSAHDGVVKDWLFELALAGVLFWLLAKIVWVFPFTALVIVPLVVLFFFGPQILGGKDGGRKIDRT